MKNIPVLIIGGGPVGLSLSLALSRQNISSVVIERHSDTTNHPRARGVNVRTMELFKQWGNATELLKYEQPKEARRIIWAKSLQGEEITRVTMDDSNASIYSPTHASLVSQDRVEESLYHSLLSYKEAEVEFSKECVSFEEDDAGVTVRILDRTNNNEELIRAQYLIAADGAHSRIRNKLGIDMIGPDNMGQFCNVFCELDIRKWTKSRPFIGMFFVDPGLTGRLIASVDGDKRWIVGMRFFGDMTKENFTDDYCISEIRRVVGISDLPVKIINKNFWTMAAQIASQYRMGRIFLVGDAAHRLPPTGGFGMNTGIQDAHNLAWKLAYVINHHISDRLLDTYFEERARIAEQNIKWSTENATRYDAINAAIRSGDMEKLKEKLHEQSKNLNYLGLDLGFIYHSNAINSESNQALSITPSEYVPTTLPGSRAPHVKLIKNDKEISTLDLFERDFVLLVGSEGESWRKSATELIQKLSFQLKIYKVAANGDLFDPNNIWHETYGITKNGAVLVRPDGHVGWRSKSINENSKIELEKYFNKLQT